MYLMGDHLMTILHCRTHIMSKIEVGNHRRTHLMLVIAIRPNKTDLVFMVNVGTIVAV